MTRGQTWFNRFLLVLVLGVLPGVIVFEAVAHAAPERSKICPHSRTLAKRVNCLVKAVRWERKVRRHQARVRYQASVDTAFRVAEIVYGMPRSQARAVGECESHLNPLERNSVTATGVMQELDSTFHRTPFGALEVVLGGRPVIGSFDAFVNIMAAGYIWRRDGGSWREWVCQP